MPSCFAIFEEPFLYVDAVLVNCIHISAEHEVIHATPDLQILGKHTDAAQVNLVMHRSTDSDS